MLPSLPLGKPCLLAASPPRQKNVVQGFLLALSLFFPISIELFQAQVIQYFAVPVGYLVGSHAVLALDLKLLPMRTEFFLEFLKRGLFLVDRLQMNGNDAAFQVAVASRLCGRQLLLTLTNQVFDLNDFLLHLF